MEKLTPKIEKVLLFLIYITFFISLIILAIRSLITHKGILILILMLLAVLLIPFILSITYFYYDLTKQVFIDKIKGEILINKKGEKIIIKHEDVVESFFVKVNPENYNNRRIRFPFFKYIVLVLKERRKVYITCLLCNPELIIEVLRLNSKFIFFDIPFIYTYLGNSVLTTQEFGEKVIEFENNFKDYSNTKLIEIINNKRDYTKPAVEAASRLLKRRK